MKGEMYRLNLLVFDWDGTLMDSEAQIVGCMQAAIADLGLEPRTRDEIKNIIGLGLKEAVSALYPHHDARLVTALAGRYRGHWLAGDGCSTLFPGVERTLTELREAGYQLAIATGKGRSGLDKVLAETGLRQLFSATRCADETRSKPHPLMLEQLMAELSAAPHETVMIGDTEYDMEMARNAATHSVAVSYGVHEPERLRPYGPLACLDRLSELNDCLRRLAASGKTPDVVT